MVLEVKAKILQGKLAYLDLENDTEREKKMRLNAVDRLYLFFFFARKLIGGF